MADTKKPLHEQVAERLLDMLKQGTAPWLVPWEGADGFGFMPMNPTSGNRYKGVNAVILMAQERQDPRWLTYKQAQTVGAQVRKGERGTTIQFWKTHNEFVKKDELGNPVIGDNGNPVKVWVKLERPYVFFATVFNAEQVDGLPPIDKKEISWNPVERAEGILAESKAVIKHSESNTAYYSPSKDAIFLPNKSQFTSADKYYATALHELGHWTGHESRLNRDILHPFGSVGYSKEEMRAELFSMFLGDTLGIGHDPQQHAAYIGSWIEVLSNDPMELFRAAADADKIQQYVLTFDRQQVQMDTIEIKQQQDQEREKVYVPLTDEEKNQKLQLASEMLADRGAKREAAHNQAMADKMAGLVPLDHQTSHLERNGIPPQLGLFTDGNGNDIYIPLVDATGKQRSIVSIQSDGNKQFMSYSDMDGWFFVIGGHKQIESANTVIITEDLASGSALNKATGLPVAVTFNADGMKAAAKDINSHYPDKGLIVAGERGNKAAIEAAQAVNGKAVFPIFAAGEAAKHADGLSSFHDLSLKSRLGNEAVSRQLKPLLNRNKEIDVKPETAANDRTRGNKLKYDEGRVPSQAIKTARGRGR